MSLPTPGWSAPIRRAVDRGDRQAVSSGDPALRQEVVAVNAPERMDSGRFPASAPRWIDREANCGVDIPGKWLLRHFCFHEDLNDFLLPEQRSREFPVPSARNATTKHMIEALGVPHTEVELILVDGQSVGFDRLLRDGDRVAVYPGSIRSTSSPCSACASGRCG